MWPRLTEKVVRNNFIKYNWAAINIAEEREIFEGSNAQSKETSDDSDDAASHISDEDVNNPLSDDFIDKGKLSDFLRN